MKRGRPKKEAVAKPGTTLSLREAKVFSRRLPSGRILEVERLGRLRVTVLDAAAISVAVHSPSGGQQEEFSGLSYVPSKICQHRYVWSHRVTKEGGTYAEGWKPWMTIGAKCPCLTEKLVSRTDFIAIHED